MHELLHLTQAQKTSSQQKVDDKIGNDMIDLGFDRKNRKKSVVYDWTLLIPETHKEIGSMFRVLFDMIFNSIC